MRGFGGMLLSSPENHGRFARWILALLAGSAAAAVASAQTPEAQRPYAERVRVDVRSVLVFLTAPDGGPPAPAPSPADLELREDGEVAEILEVEPALAVAVPADSSGEALSLSGEGARVSREDGIPQYLYVDAPFLEQRSVRYVVHAMRANLAAILQKGPLEIVLANPQPKIILESTRDFGQADAALQWISGHTYGGAALTRLRTESRVDGRRPEDHSRLRPENRGQKPEDRRIRTIAEWQLLRAPVETLAAWAATLADEGSGVLYFANDGFGFIGSVYGNSFQAALENPEKARDEALLVAELARSLASLRLIMVPMAFGWLSNLPGGAESPKAPLFGGPDGEMVTPRLDNLRTLADTTGGSVITAENRLPAMVDRLRNAYRVFYRSHVPQAGKAHRLAIHARRGDLRVDSSRYSSGGTPLTIARARAIRAFRSNQPPNADFPLRVSIVTDRSAAKRRGTLRIQADLTSIASVLDAVGGGRMRITAAIEIEGSPAFVQHAEIELTRENAGSRWTYQAPLEWPKGGRRVSVLVEELTTGTRSTELASLPVL